MDFMDLFPHCIPRTGSSKLSGIAVRVIHRLGLAVYGVGGMMLGPGVAFAVPTASAFWVQESGECAAASI